MIYDSLQNYVQLRQGFAINKATDSFVSNEQSQEFPYPLLRIADMINGKYAKYVSKKIHKSVIVNQNDLIYTRTGQIGLVFTGFEGVLHNNSFIVDVIDDKIDKQYLYTALQSSFVRQQALTLAKNSVQPDLTHDMFKKIIIPFPSKDIQYKIAGIIGAINKKIVLNNRVNATLEAMAKTLYDYWFVQFDFPDEKGRPYKTSGGKMVYNEELGREIPAGWEVKPLHDICTVISGYPFDSSLYDTDGNYHILTIKNIQNGYIVPQTDSNIHAIPSDIPAIDILKIGDILMSLTGNVGRVGILCGNNYLLNQRAAIVQPQFDNIKWFLYFMFRNSAICMQIQNISTGTSQKNVSPIDIGNIKIPYADRYMQNFNDTILSMVNTIIAKTVESQKLAVLRDWLLPMLMNGQVGFRKGKGK